MTLLSTRGLGVSYRGRIALNDATLSVGAGECVGLIGPNGAGKSTFLRAALGLLPASGYASLHGLRGRERARRVAFLPQQREVAWPVTAEAIVALGCEARGAGPKDSEAIAAAMARMDVAALRGRRADRLSGGELARVLLARALAQETPLLLADEPTAGLDPAHQIAAMQTFASLAAEGRSVVVSLHDLGLAARWCSRIVMMSEGRIVADGTPRAVLTRERLAEIYAISAHISDTAEGMVIQPTGPVAPATRPSLVVARG